LLQGLSQDNTLENKFKECLHVDFMERLPIEKVIAGTMLQYKTIQILDNLWFSSNCALNTKIQAQGNPNTWQPLVFFKTCTRYKDTSSRQFKYLGLK